MRVKMNTARTSAVLRSVSLFEIVILPVCFLLQTPAPSQSPGLPTLLGGWQSVECTPEPYEGCRSVWREFHDAGTVTVITRNQGGIKRSVRCEYQADAGRLVESCPLDPTVDWKLEFDGRFLSLSQTQEWIEGSPETWTEKFVRQSAPSLELTEAPEMPQTAPEAIAQLRKLLSRRFIESVEDAREEEFTTGAHFGLGLWMRNSFGLWARYELARSLEILGLRQPDDMSGLLLTVFWRLVHGQTPALKQEIRRYVEFSLGLHTDRPLTSPQDGSPIAFVWTLPCPDELEEEPCVRFLGRTVSDGRTWVYEAETGLRPAFAPEVAALDGHFEHLEELERQIVSSWQSAGPVSETRHPTIYVDLDGIWVSPDGNMKKRRPVASVDLMLFWIQSLPEEAWSGGRRIDLWQSPRIALRIEGQAEPPGEAVSLRDAVLAALGRLGLEVRRLPVN